MTPEQETWLAAFADKGLAEDAEAAQRQADLDNAMVVNTARVAKLADLQAQAQALIDSGLADFDSQVAPTLVESSPSIKSN